ncbi:MAG: RNA 2',3'-cyclic phosphodiesterase [bacterium]|nr:RNA 2',3'-cyclic phosphodiesterase [bacterium]
MNVSLTRVFFALEIPGEVKRQLERETNTLRDRLPKGRWVRSAGLHLTLKFLGEHPRGIISRVAESVTSELSQCSKVAVKLRGAGFFPSSARPRVAWIGGEAEGAAELSRIVDDAAAAEGLERERRSWALHLTLARLKKPWPQDAVVSFLEWGEAVSFEPFTCREVVLFESRLDPSGAVYTPIERMALA